MAPSCRARRGVGGEGVGGSTNHSPPARFFQKVARAHYFHSLGQDQSTVAHHLHHHHHQSLNREGRLGTTDDFATNFYPFFPVLHYPLGLAELQACLFPDVVFPPLLLSALSSSPFHCALQDGFGQT